MPHIKHIAFNSYQDCFVVSSDYGVRVFNVKPLIELLNLKYDTVGSVKMAAILDRTNVVAIVSGEPRPKFSNKSVMIWDDAKQKFVVELTVCSPVLNVLMSLSRIVVVQRHHIHVFSMGNFELAAHDETGLNVLGLCALSPNPKDEYLVFPSFKAGSVQVVNLRNVSQSRSAAPATIDAHESEIAKLAIDNQATKIATGSVKGTVIRIFDTQSKAKLFELRRGAHSAQLFCFRFSPDSSYLACCSDQGTIHVFSVTHTHKDKSLTTKNLFDQLRLKDERRSVVQFAMPNPEQIAECAFLTEDLSKSDLDLVAVTKDGFYYHFSEWNTNASASRMNTKPQGYELVFNLAHDQEFWKV